MYRTGNDDFVERLNVKAPCQTNNFSDKASTPLNERPEPVSRPMLYACDCESVLRHKHSFTKHRLKCGLTGQPFKKRSLICYVPGCALKFYK